MIPRCVSKLIENHKKGVSIQYEKYCLYYVQLICNDFALFVKSYKKYRSQISVLRVNSGLLGDLMTFSHDQEMYPCN